MLLEQGENVGDSGLDLLVRVDDDLAVVVIDQADRQGQAERAAFGRRVAGTVQTVGEDMQLGLLCGPCRYAEVAAGSRHGDRARP
ncbi:hypothetical protein ABZ504_56125 [Streptomyces mirabilis]|uniref:hypothetical protein n=1 Tax=Streptomyces mirabilis TaxID=68239 RepID=UPI0033EBF78A